MTVSDDSSVGSEDRGSVDALRNRAQTLENELADVRAKSDQRAIRGELRVEAVRAGIVDLDGLQLLDTAGLAVSEDGTVTGAPGAIQAFRKEKPWLFGLVSSSSPTSPPLSHPPRSRSAMEMSDAEYAAVRAAMLKQHY